MSDSWSERLLQSIDEANEEILAARKPRDALYAIGRKFNGKLSEEEKNAICVGTRIPREYLFPDEENKMGMFDYVEVPYTVMCPSCKEPLDDPGWQSKDGPCSLSTISYTQVDEFYTRCKCGTQVHFVLRKRPPAKLEEFNLVTSEAEFSVKVVDGQTEYEELPDDICF